MCRANTGGKQVPQSRNRLGQPVAEDKKAIARDNLVEEIADVELMLEQVKYLLQIPEDELLAVKTFKVNRTRERMENSK